MREWTEKHIRELIDDEYKRIKKDNGTNDYLLRTLDLSYYVPSFETSGYSIGGLMMKKWYFYADEDSKGDIRAECPVYSPGNFIYSQIKNVYEIEGERIVGAMIIPLSEKPYWGCPEIFTKTHYDDLSKSGIDTLSNNHNAGIVVWKWSAYDENNDMYLRPFARLRNQEGAVADFNLGIISQDAITVDERTEEMTGMRLGFVVPYDDQVTAWRLYDWNYSDYYYPNDIMPAVGNTKYTNTICFLYKKTYSYAVEDGYYKS